MTGLRVAVVDDQALMRTGFTMILGSEPGIEVVGDAGDGREGVELCRRERPDVVLMDVRMPVMDGIEATALIVDDPSLDTKVLVLTTFDLDDYVFAAVRAGVRRAHILDGRIPHVLLLEFFTDEGIGTMVR